MIQINLTGFLGGSKARIFVGELWAYLASAQAAPDGIPPEFVEMKREELRKQQVRFHPSIEFDQSSSLSLGRCRTSA